MIVIVMMVVGRKEGRTDKKEGRIGRKYRKEERKERKDRIGQEGRKEHLCLLLVYAGIRGLKQQLPYSRTVLEGRKEGRKDGRNE
jgi:hypothetical protein